MADLKNNMTVERVFLGTAHHPDRRRVKFMPVSRTRDERGQDVVLDNTAWVGEYPILWSQRVGDGERLIVMLVDDEQGLTAHGRISEADFLSLPETDIEW